MPETYTADPWDRLRAFTSARIALGRAGASVPTHEMLAFQMHHARAIDAVYTELDREALEAQLIANGLTSLCLETRADSREEYLLRPDFGRRLNDDSKERLTDAAKDLEKADITVVLVDGLSATALHRNAIPVAMGLIERLRQKRISVSPIPIIRYGRVALQDELGSILKSQIVVSLIGERPGLGSPDSLGAYLVFDPRLGNTDANRNCVSNIRPEGLPHAAAVDTLEWLITESIRRKISGVELKDDRVLNAIDVPRDVPSELP